jgi:hypothetical protein
MNLKVVRRRLARKFMRATINFRHLNGYDYLRSSSITAFAIGGRSGQFPS